MHLGKKARHILSLLALLLPTACGTLAYYDQAIRGQAHILLNRQSVELLLDNVETQPELRQRLLTAREIQHFAVTELKLPATDSYQQYADLQRPYSVWVVFATPWDDLKPKTWCYPVVGCLSYRGFYQQRDALALARQLEDEGMDTYVQGVAAYSTLGWFADPLLNTFIRWPNPSLAHLLFHEITHEQLYIRDDTDFNESYAEAVAQTGVQRWLASRPPCSRDETLYRNAQTAKAAFLRLIPPAREQLQTLYQSQLPGEEKRFRKQEIILHLIQQYQQEKLQWDKDGRYEKWFTPGVNNAKLASVFTYNRWVGAFLHLLEMEQGDMAAFHAHVARLASLPPDQRQARLLELKP